jgi:uncharacterized repeat protein (TIGR01451 family)
MATSSFTIFPFDGSPAEVLVLLEDISTGVVQVTLSIDPSTGFGDIVGFFTNLEGVTVNNNFSVTSGNAEPGDTEFAPLTVGDTPGVGTLFLDDSGSTQDFISDIDSDIHSYLDAPLSPFDLAVQIGSALRDQGDDYQRVTFQLIGPSDFDSDDIKKVGVQLKSVGTSSDERTGSQFLEADVFLDSLATQAQRRTIQSPSIDVRKRADVTAIDEVGDVINYTIDVENTGDVDLTNIRVTDSLIPDLTLTSGDTDQDGVLDVGETFRFTGSYTVTQDTVNTSIATALEASDLSASSEASLSLSNFSHTPVLAESEAIADTFASAELFGEATADATAEAQLESPDLVVISDADASSAIKTDGRFPLEGIDDGQPPEPTTDNDDSDAQAEDDVEGDEAPLEEAPLEPVSEESASPDDTTADQSIDDSDGSDRVEEGETFSDSVEDSDSVEGIDPSAPIDEVSQTAPPENEPGEEIEVTAANNISNQTTASGLKALGVAQSESSVIGEFEIKAGETFSFDFDGQLNLLTNVGDPIFGDASAGSEIFLGLFDAEQDPESAPLDFLAIAGQVVNSESEPDDDFLDIQASDAVTLDPDQSDISTDFDGAEQSAQATVSGSFQKTFEADTKITLVETKIGGAVSEAELKGGSPIVNTVTVDTDQTDPISAEASVDVEIVPEIAIDIQKLTNGVDADTAEEAVTINPEEEVVWTYQVSNLGNVSLENVVVKDDNGTPNDKSDDFLPTFVDGDMNQNGLLDPDEMWIFTAVGVAKDLSVSINFDVDSNGAALVAGSVIEDQFASVGVTVSTPDNEFGAMIFDSANPTGGDTDLGTPSQPNGPGIGRDEGAGIGNVEPQGNILIISEDGDSNDPDDNAKGGTMQFDFDDPVRVTGVGLLDIDQKEKKVTVETFEGDRLIQSYAAQNLGDNSFQTLDLSGELVDQLNVNLVGSGAVTAIDFNSIFKNTGSVTANFSDVFVTASDASHYENSIDL